MFAYFLILKLIYWCYQSKNLYGYSLIENAVKKEIFVIKTVYLCQCYKINVGTVKLPASQCIVFNQES